MSQIGKPQPLRGLMLAGLYLLGVLGVVGCGGGGGGGGSDDDSISYVGNRDHAVITRDNASRLVANVMTGNTLVEAASKAGGEFETSTAATDEAFDSVRYSGRLTRRIRSLVHPQTSLYRGSLATSARTEIDITDTCDSGSVEITGFIEDDLSGQLELLFKNCREGNETLNGLVSGQINVFNPVLFLPTDAVYSFGILTLSTPGYSMSISGSIRSRLLFGSLQREELTVTNLVSRNNANGEMLWISNQLSLLDYDNLLFPTRYTASVSGRIYDSIHGYVDFTTEVVLNFDSLVQEFSNAGQLRLTGAANASIRVVAVSSSHAQLNLDLDGNAAFEIFVSLGWSEIETGVGLTDTDDDGMHDAWELANGLDPSDPADAALDSDSDGFSNLVEYQAGTNPQSAASVPQVTDLSIGTSLLGNALTGASVSYQLAVSNSGLFSARNVVVTNQLPAGAVFGGVVAAAWNCTEAGGTVTCTRFNLSPGQAPLITITATLPLVPGNVTNQASVQSGTPDDNQANNVDTLVSTLTAVAPSASIHLGAPVFDFEVDSARNLVYVSVPSQNAIRIVSLGSFSVTGSLIVGSRPHGLAMTPDGATLYVALNQTGAVARVNLDTHAVSEIVVADELGSARAYDVAAPSADEVFVSANPGSSGLAYIVRIDTANADLAARVAGSRIIRANPVFVARPNPQFLYVGEGFSPNSVYKLDLNQAGVPIVLEDAHGSIGGADHLALSADGTKLFLTSGQVLDTSTLVEIGTIGSGVSSVGSGDAQVRVGEAGNRIGIYDYTTYQKVDDVITACHINDFERIVELQPGGEWLLLGQQALCRAVAPSPTNPVAAEADLTLNLALSGDPVTGGSASYSLEVFNQGPISSSNLVVTNQMPAGAGFVSAGGSGWSCWHNTGLVTCNRGSLAAGQAATITLDIVYPAAAGTATNNASVSAATTDPDAANNSASLVANLVVPATSTNLDLGSAGFDLEYDGPRQRLYVSVPGLNSIEVISLATFTVVNSILVGNSPQGIDMSPDGSMLYVALNQTGEVAVVDLANLTFSTINLATELGDTRAYDVIAATASDVFVSGNPGSSGLSYIVRIDTANANQLSRVASNAIIRGAPVFAAAPAPAFLYVGEGFSPNSLYKLDLNQAGVPLVLQDVHGSVSGAYQMAISADGSRLFLGGGQVFRTDGLTQAGLLGSGVKAVSAGGEILVGDAPNGLAIFDASTQLEIDQVFNTCNLNGVDRIEELQPGSEWVVLGQQWVCRINRP